MKSKRRDEICDQISAKRCKLSELVSQKVELEEELKALKSRYNDLNGINSLPFEVLCLILKRAALSDLLVCEQVCQKWNEIVKQMKIEEAVIAKLGEAPKEWYQNGQPVQPDSIIVKSELKFEHFENTFLTSVKRLKICNSSDDPQSNRMPHIPLIEDLEFVNRLTCLEVLEIAQIKFDQDVTLSLPNLRCLAIKELASGIKLNCPNLVEFINSKSTSAYPEYVFKAKITHLQLDTVYRNNEMFANLEYICWKACGHFCHDALLPTNRNLKLLSVRPPVSTYYYKYAKKNFLSFLQQKNELGPLRAHPKLVFFGVLLENSQQLENLNDESDKFQDLTKLQLLNYDDLYDDELRWIRTMNYSSVMRAIGDSAIGEVPEDLHRRFDRVETVYVDAPVADEDHLIEFLKKFKRFKKFSVKKATLSGAFYERLAGKLPQIRKLFIHEAGKHFDCLQFIFKFPNLIELKIKGPKIGEEFVRTLFTIYPVFKLIFKNDSRYEDYETFWRAHPKMRIELLSNEPRDFYDVNELIEFYYQNYDEENDVNEANEESDDSGSD